MPPFTSYYETIKKTLSKDKFLNLALISDDMTTPNQSKIQSTFLQIVCSKKIVVTLIVVVLATGVLTYTTNSVAISSHQLRVCDYAAIVDGSKSGGFIGIEKGGGAS